MAHASIVNPAPQAVPITIPVREIWPWALFMAVIGLFLLYLVGLDQGVTNLFGGETIHEFFHDGRHMLAFPCH